MSRLAFPRQCMHQSGISQASADCDSSLDLYRCFSSQISNMQTSAKPSLGVSVRWGAVDLQPQIYSWKNVMTGSSCTQCQSCKRGRCVWSITAVISTPLVCSKCSTPRLGGQYK